MSNRFKKTISSFVLISLIGFCFVSPFTVNKADAFLGIGDITFNTTMGDIPRFLYDIGVKITKFYFEKLKKRMITQLQNDLVNWVQGNGKPRFITDPSKFIKDNAQYAAVSGIDKFFSGKGVDICSPFKANVQLLVNRTKLLQEDQLRCSLGDIKDNLSNFAENFENGGWTTWLKLHETRNTLPGTYLASSQLIGADISTAGNTATAKISAGKGFLDQKKCSAAKYPQYELEFRDNHGVLNNVPLDDFPEARSIIRGQNFQYDWKSLWPQILEYTEYKSIEDINIESTRLIETGEYTPPIEITGDTPPGAICTKEETITPGSIIGDQISGTLKSTGIDKLINAQDISQILDAVLDAAVNRAAKEGLSYMKSGRGSQSTPFTPREATKTQQQLTGLESTDAVSLQNQMVDLRNASSKLKLELRKLSGKEDKLTKFNQRLIKIAGYYEGTTYIPGSVITPSQTDLKTVRAKDTDKKFSDAADRFFGKASSQLFYEGGGGGISFADGLDFVKEENIPGVYLANKEILKKLSTIWKAIGSIFSNISNTTKSCSEVHYILEPQINSDGLDAIPFIVGEDTAVYWASHEEGYATRISKAIPEGNEKLSADTVRSYLITESGNAEIKSEEYTQLAESYESLTENSSEISAGLDSDIEFVKENMPNVLKYSSMLLDYDSIGRKYDIIKKINKYNEIIGNENKTFTDPQTNEVLTHQEALEKFYNELITARRSTLNEWASTVSADKQEIASKAKSLIESSLLENPNDIVINAAGHTLLNTDNIGIKTSEAVSEAMGMNVEGLVSELEERQIKIGKQQTDVSNRLGKFLDNADQRKQAMVEGGDSEWEKHFKNRMQLVYATFIYDFYKNRYIQEFCN